MNSFNNTLRESVPLIFTVWILLDKLTGHDARSGKKHDYVIHIYV